MIRPEKLEVRVWKATVGQWGPIQSVFKRFDKNTASVLSLKTSGLVNHLASKMPEFNLVNFVNNTLPIGADRLSAKQYEEALELVARLVDAGINPTYLLTTAVPALAQCCTAGD